jgi:sirohydrochlorin cobaltochelatase
VRLIDLFSAYALWVTLLPLMVVAGDHAANDMAGDEPDSWKNMFNKAGIEVIPVLRGPGELGGWADIYVQHLNSQKNKLFK